MQGRNGRNRPCRRPGVRRQRTLRATTVGIGCRQQQRVRSGRGKPLLHPAVLCALFVLCGKILFLTKPTTAEAGYSQNGVSRLTKTGWTQGWAPPESSK